MGSILSGFIIGLLIFAAAVAILIKTPPLIQRLMYKHMLVTDIIFTAIAYVLFPVVGQATLVGLAVFCILFSLYLWYMNKNLPVKEKE